MNALMIVFCRQDPQAEIFIVDEFAEQLDLNILIFLKSFIINITAKANDTTDILQTFR